MTDTGDAKFEKLQLELVQLRKEVRRPWLIQLVVPALVTTLVGAFGGYVFSDSLAARTRAEMRKSTMDRYFSVDNEVIGKRKQMLDFIEATLAKEDPDLTAWVVRERIVVEGQLLNLEDEKRKLDALSAQQGAPVPIRANAAAELTTVAVGASEAVSAKSAGANQRATSTGLARHAKPPSEAWNSERLARAYEWEAHIEQRKRAEELRHITAQAPWPDEPRRLDPQPFDTLHGNSDGK